MRSKSRIVSDVSAAIYCRISLASTGDTTKTDDQERICRELCERKGWQVRDVYVDHAKSAWQPNRKRPAWDKMIADVEHGLISAIVVYHGDRLLRTHEDLLKLLHLARTRDIKLASPAGERDLGNYDDQFILEIEASMAKRESANTSRRRKAQYERMRREGRVRPGGYGGRAFGFSSDGLTHVDAEAEALRDAAAMILAGEGLRAATRELAGRGLTGVTGKPLGHKSLRSALMRPGTAGLMPDGVSVAAWPAVLDRETWETTRAILDGRAVAFHGYATNARKNLLSGIARCGVCDSGLQLRAESRSRTGNEHGERDGYGCVRPGCRKVQRNIRMLDAYVTRRVINLLANPLNPAPQIPGKPELASEFATLTRARAETASAIENPSSAHLLLLLKRLDTLDKRLLELRELAAESAAAKLRQRHSGVSFDEFANLPLDVRRSLVQSCFTVIVLPASRRGPGFNPDDVQLRRVT